MKKGKMKNTINSFLDKFFHFMVFGSVFAFRRKFEWFTQLENLILVKGS